MRRCSLGSISIVFRALWPWSDIKLRLSNLYNLLLSICLVHLVLKLTELINLFYFLKLIVVEPLAQDIVTHLELPALSLNSCTHVERL